MENKDNKSKKKGLFRSAKKRLITVATLAGAMIPQVPKREQEDSKPERDPSISMTLKEDITQKSYENLPKFIDYTILGNGPKYSITAVDEADRRTAFLDSRDIPKQKERDFGKYFSGFGTYELDNEGNPVSKLYFPELQRPKPSFNFGLNLKF